MPFITDGKERKDKLMPKMLSGLMFFPPGRRPRLGVALVVTAGLATFILLTGCKPSAEQQRTARLDLFRKRMEQIDGSITVGMSYPDLVAKIGQPFWSRTNHGWIMTKYLYDPHVFHGLITNGFRIDVSNNVVIGKYAITGTSN